MDTFTHAFTGALAARVIAARQRGGVPPSEPATEGRFAAPWDGRGAAPAPWQCVLVGLVAGAFPDADALVQLYGDVAYLRHHRGLTHSLLVLPAWAFVVSWLMALCFAVTRRQQGGWKSLYLVAVAAIALHIAGDWITQFGTTMLTPLSDRRFGLGAMFIIDLSFTGLLLAGLALAALWPSRRWPAVLGLLAGTAWVGMAWTGQQEALEVGRQQAAARGWKVERIDVMPRPASPFNWTVSIFDGTQYHLAHLNTRRDEPVVAEPDDNFIRRFTAPYLPVPQASWRSVPRFGADGTPAWVETAWNDPSFAFYRWFAMTPALTGHEETTDNQGRRQRCAWFRDLRFEFPGRDASPPFQYGVCLSESPDGSTAANAFKWQDGVRVPV